MYKSQGVICFKQQDNSSSFIGFKVRLTSELGHSNSALAETVPQAFAVQRRCLHRQHCKKLIQIKLFYIKIISPYIYFASQQTLFFWSLSYH